LAEKIMKTSEEVQGLYDENAQVQVAKVTALYEMLEEAITK